MDNMLQNKITFWGVRGSIPTPDKNKMDYGGHTSCVSLNTKNNNLLIMDMGTGLKELGHEIISNPNPPKIIHIILSHYHWDHVLGMLFFAPLFIEGYTIHFYGKKENLSLKSIFDHILHPIFWPVSRKDFKAKLYFHDLEDGLELNIENEIKVNTQIHGHPNGALSFRVTIDEKNFTYITDCEHPDAHLNKNLINLAKNTDVLIHDAHFTPEDLINHKGWGHSSWQQAVDIAIDSKAKKLILFHHNPIYDDDFLAEIEIKAQKKLNGTIAAKQGLVIYL